MLKDGIRAALKRMKCSITAGGDQIPAEALKTGGETTMQVMKSIIDQIWTTGDWPEEWVTSELTVLPTVLGTQNAQNTEQLA